MSWLAGARKTRTTTNGARPSRRDVLGAMALGGVALAVGASALGANVARATVMVEVPFERLAAESDVIVHGRVVRTGSRLVIDASGTQPHTITELDVYEPIKGAVGDRLVIDEIGGTMQDRGLWIEGTPRYRRGEECVVFLRALPDGSYRTYAMAQGHFEIRPGVPGVAPTVVRDTSAVGFASWAHDVMEIQPGVVASMPLDAFLDHVRNLAAATGGAR